MKRNAELLAHESSGLAKQATELEKALKSETNSERIARLIAENPNKVVEGRTLLEGYQWNGLDCPGRGNAPAQRRRQAEKLAAKR